MLHDTAFIPAGQGVPAWPLASDVAPSVSRHSTRDTRLPTLPILGLPVVDATTHDTAEALLDGAARQVFFVNAHCLNIRAAHRDYAAALARADHILPDGIGVELAAKMTGHQLTQNLNGTDFVPELLARAARRGLSVFLVGGRPGTAQAAAGRLAVDIPGLRIAGTLDGYKEAQDEAAAVAQINASGADILLVAMGVPMQELWLDRNLPLLKTRLNLGVGALFDFLAGNVQRAPAVVRRARAEWAWRLAQEPRRLARRYLIGNGTFLARAGWHAFRNRDRTATRKRALDLTLTTLGIIPMLPIFGLIALAIKLDSRGPVFFQQDRVGKDGRIFRMLKFRSMVQDAGARRAALLQTSDRAGICFKSRHDPRVTRVGRLLRRYSLDELPQILNVLMGQMSLVGPRPALPEETRAYPAHARERLSVKPGLTGLWQVSGRADIGFEKMVDMDVAYARSRSVLLDLMLIALTFRVVLSGRGAY
ncbi:MAG: WecB/TagA/CpsF family glycosyltransferase [Thalassovita sp.]